jgi:hypothetical protein
MIKNLDKELASPILMDALGTHPQIPHLFASFDLSVPAAGGDREYETGVMNPSTCSDGKTPPEATDTNFYTYRGKIYKKQT